MRGAVFDDLIDLIDRRFECAAPDLPGHGTAADLPPSLDACADLVARTLDALSARRAVIVGWSMGAAAAWRYVERHGTGRLAGLMTVDMSPRVVPGHGWPHGLIGQTAESVSATTRRFATDWEEATHGIAATMFAGLDGAPGLTREDARSLILGQDPAKMRALWDDMVAMDARPVIPTVDLPYLVASGARSRVYPASASHWIACHAPQTKRHVFALSGHSPHLEEPDAFASVLSEFAGTLSA